MIEVPPKGAAEGFDASKIPVGEIGQGAIFDFAVFAEGLAKENGGGELRLGIVAMYMPTRYDNYLFVSRKILLLHDYR
jgi:hypothetical protein